MNTKKLKPLICLVALLSLTTARADVKFKHDETVDFSTYKTYTWGEGTRAARPEVQDFIVSAVDRHLVAKGLTRAAPHEADLTIHTDVFAEMDMRLAGGYTSTQWDWGLLVVSTREMTTGTMMIDIRDRRADKSVWTAMATTGITSDLPDKIEKKVEKITRKLFKHFPP